MYSYKRERAKRLYPEPAIFNTLEVCATIGPFIRPEGGGHRPRCDGMSVKGWSFTSSMACS